MASHKHSRNSEDIKRELTDIIRTLKDPRITGMLSIVKVDLSGDQSLCRVYVSSLDGLAAAKEAAAGLNNAAGFVRREINLRLEGLRRSPELKFIADDSIAYGAEMDQKIKKLSISYSGDSGAGDNSGEK